MDFALLHVFETVTDEGTVTGAARKLHRVPSNVTTRLKHLEATLGKRLFVRHRAWAPGSDMAGERLCGFSRKIGRSRGPHE